MREQTNQEKITYIAHSQGTAQMFYALSMYPKYFADRINLFVAFNPVVYLRHSRSRLMRIASRTTGFLERRLQNSGVYELFGKGWSSSYGFIRDVIPIAKMINVYDPEFNIELSDKEKSAQLMGHFPHGTSVRSLNHFG